MARAMQEEQKEPSAENGAGPASDPADAQGLRRIGLTLAAAKAALQKWQGHMRRAAQLGNEEEYAAALALVPLLPNPKAYRARTLRALADFCAAQGRLDEACALFGQVGDDAGSRHLSNQFWRDYATLLFRLALKRVAAGQVALANETLNRAAQLLEGPAAQPEAWAAAWEGYAETALWFERAGEALPAALYAERALGFALRLGRPQDAAPWLRKLAQAAVARSGAERGLVWLDRLRSLGAEGWAPALATACQAALGLARTELGVGRGAGAQAIFRAAEGWLAEAGAQESLAAADLHLGWGLALGGGQGRGQLELALSLRKRLLGPQHPRTREADQALAGLAQSAPATEAPSGPRSWDGGADFSPAPAAESGAEAEIRRLRHRLARLCHPDAATDPADAARRHEWMVRVNRAAELGDLFSLRAQLREVLALQAARPS